MYSTLLQHILPELGEAIKLPPILYQVLEQKLWGKNSSGIPNSRWQGTQRRYCGYSPHPMQLEV